MDSAERALKDRVAFYGKLGVMLKDDETSEVVLMAELFEFAQKRFPLNSINVFNDTPKDRDGYIFKVTIT